MNRVIFLVVLCCAVLAAGMPALTQQPLYLNVKDFGAIGNGTADDTLAVQNTINAAVSGATPTYKVFLPPGNYRITSTLTLSEYCNSLQLFGAGSYSLVAPAPTRITWAGTAGGTMIDSPKCLGLHLNDIRLDGNNTAGVILRVNSTPGLPSACWNIERVTFCNATTGIECGSASDACASDMTLIDANFDRLTVAFHTMAHQNVNYSFIRPITGNCDIGLWFEKGGSATVNLLSGSFVGTAVRIDAGDVNTGNYYFNGVKIETYKWKGKRTVLFDVKGYASTVRIAGLCTSTIDQPENGAPPYTPLFLLGPRATVTVDTSILSGLNIAEMSGAPGGAPTWLRFNNCLFTSCDPRAAITCNPQAGFSLHECKLGNGMIADYKVDPDTIATETPASLTAATASTTQINLSWTNVQGETGYEVERSPDGTNNWTRIATPAADVTTYPDSGLPINTTFYYRVRAVNGVNASWWSTVVKGGTAGNYVPAQGQLLWLKADAGVTKDAANKVSVWADQSGNGNDLLQGTLERQPTWTDNVLNGKPVLHFNGLGQNTSFLTIGGKSWDMNHCSLIFVIKPTSFWNYNQRISSFGGWGQFMFLADSAGGVYAGMWAESRLSPAELPAGTLVAGNWQSCCITFDRHASPPNDVDGDIIFYKNGNRLARKAIKIPQLWTGFVLGNDTEFNALHGEVAEVLLYNATLSDQDRVSLDNYLRAKYGL